MSAPEQIPSPEIAAKIQGPIEPLIKQAKQAQASIGKIPQDNPDIDGGRNPQEASDYKPPDELDMLLKKIQGYTEGDTQPSHESRSVTSIQELHFHTLDEGPSEGISDRDAEGETYEPTDRRKQRLKQEVADLQKQLLDDSRYVNLYLTGFQSGSSGLRPEREGDIEEYNALSLLIARTGYGQSEPYRSVPHAPDLIYQTASTLRKSIQAWGSGLAFDETRRPVWKGIEYPQTYHSEFYADAILKQLQKVVGQDRQTGRSNIRPEDLDVCVLTSLACGEVQTAFDLVKLASQFFPGQEFIKPEYTLSRLKKVIAEARKLTPLFAQGIDEVLLCAGEEGKYQELGSSPIALELKKAAEERVHKAIAEKRAHWYLSKEVADMDSRNEQISDDAIRTLIETTASSGETWVTVTDQVAERCKEVVDGRSANLLAAELVRRMYPDLSVDAQLQAIKARVTEASKKTVYATTHNTYETALVDKQEHTRFSNQTAQQKERTVQAVDFPDGQMLRQMIYNPERASNGEVLQTLFAFIRHSASGRGNLLNFRLNEAFALEDPANRGPGYQLATNKEKRVQEGRRLLAQRLVGGLRFLQTCTEDEEARRLIEKEFGLKSGSSYITPTRLEEAQGYLAEMFKDAVDTNGLTLYESVLPDPDQIGEDTLVLNQLRQARANELDTLRQERDGKGQEIVKAAAAERSAQLQEMQTMLQTRTDLLRRRQEISVPLPAKEAELRRLENLKVTSGLERMLGRGVTATEKTTQIAAQTAIIDAEKASIARVDQELGQIPDISNTSIDTAKAKADSLQKLAEQIS